MRAGSILRRVLLAIAAVILAGTGARARSGVARRSMPTPSTSAAAVERFDNQVDSSRSPPPPTPTASCAASRCARRIRTGRPTGSSSRSPILPTSRSTACSSSPHYRLVGSGLIWPDLGCGARPRGDAERGLRAGAGAEQRSRHLPHHARSRRHRHLRRRAQRPDGAGDPSLAAGAPTRTWSTATRSIAAWCSGSPACSRSS